MRENVLVDGRGSVASHREPKDAGRGPTEEERRGTTARVGRAAGCGRFWLGRGLLAWGHVLLSQRAGSSGLPKERLAARAFWEVVDGGEDLLRRGLVRVGLGDGFSS